MRWSCDRKISFLFPRGGRQDMASELCSGVMIAPKHLHVAQALAPCKRAGRSGARSPSHGTPDFFSFQQPSALVHHHRSLTEREEVAPSDPDWPVCWRHGLPLPLLQLHVGGRRTSSPRCFWQQPPVVVKHLTVHPLGGCEVISANACSRYIIPASIFLSRPKRGASTPMYSKDIA